MGERREPQKVIAPRVYGLHEGGLGVDQSVVLEHAVNLGDAAKRVDHMFEHRLDDHRVEAPVLKREIVTVADDDRLIAEIHVACDEIERGIVQDRVKPLADQAASYDQDQGALAALPQKLGKASVVPARADVLADARAVSLGESTQGAGRATPLGLPCLDDSVGVEDTLRGADEQWDSLEHPERLGTGSVAARETIAFAPERGATGGAAAPLDDPRRDTQLGLRQRQSPQRTRSARLSR